MATFYSVEATRATTAPTTRSPNGANGVVHTYNDYYLTTSAVSATGDIIKFRAGAIPQGARILKSESKVFFEAFGTDVDADLGDQDDPDRFWTSGDVAASGSLDLGEGLTTGAYYSADYYDVTSNDHQLQLTFKTSAPATGKYVRVSIKYVF